MTYGAETWTTTKQLELEQKPFTAQRAIERRMLNGSQLAKMKKSIPDMSLP